MKRVLRNTLCVFLAIIMAFSGFQMSAPNIAAKLGLSISASAADKTSIDNMLAQAHQVGGGTVSAFISGGGSEGSNAYSTSSASAADIAAANEAYAFMNAYKNTSQNSAYNTDNLYGGLSQNAAVRRLTNPSGTGLGGYNVNNKKNVGSGTTTATNATPATPTISYSGRLSSVTKTVTLNASVASYISSFTDYKNIGTIYTKAVYTYTNSVGYTTTDTGNVQTGTSNWETEDGCDTNSGTDTFYARTITAYEWYYLSAATQTLTADTSGAAAKIKAYGDYVTAGTFNTHWNNWITQGNNYVYNLDSTVLDTLMNGYDAVNGPAETAVGAGGSYALEAVLTAYNPSSRHSDCKEANAYQSAEEFRRVLQAAKDVASYKYIASWFMGDVASSNGLWVTDYDESFIDNYMPRDGATLKAEYDRVVAVYNQGTTYVNTLNGLSNKAEIIAAFEAQYGLDYAAHVEARMKELKLYKDYYELYANYEYFTFRMENGDAAIYDSATYKYGDDTTNGLAEYESYKFNKLQYTTDAELAAGVTQMRAKLNAISSYQGTDAFNMLFPNGFADLSAFVTALNHEISYRGVHVDYLASETYNWNELHKSESWMTYNATNLVANYNTAVTYAGEWDTAKSKAGTGYSADIDGDGTDETFEALTATEINQIFGNYDTAVIDVTVQNIKDAAYMLVAQKLIKLLTDANYTVKIGSTTVKPGDDITKLSGTLTVSGSGSVNLRNSSLVNAGINTVDHALYYWLTGNNVYVRSSNSYVAWANAGYEGYEEDTNKAGAFSTERKNNLKTMYEYIDDCKNLFDTFNANLINELKQQTKYDDGNGDGVGGDGYYVIRHAQGYADLAREGSNFSDALSAREEDDYVLSVDRVEDTIAKLDTFLTSSDFIDLIAPDADAENLTDWLKDLLGELVFSDSMVNTIVGLLFPMLCNLLVGLLHDFAVEPLQLDIDDGSLELRATLYIYTDGMLPSGISDSYRPIALSTVFNDLGLGLFPNQLATSLGQSSQASKYATARSVLNSAGTDWSVIDLNKDGSISGKELEYQGFTWGLDGIEDREARFNAFLTVIGDVFRGIVPLLQCLFCGYNYTKATGRFAYIRATYLYVFYPDVDPVFKGDLTMEAQPAGLCVDEAKITITGLDLYNNLWVWLFESLFYNDYTTSASPYYVSGYNPTPAQPFSNNFGVSGGAATPAQFADCLFTPVYALIDKLTAAPLQEVMKLLPNLMFFLTTDQINGLIERLVINLSIDEAVGRFNGDDLNITNGKYGVIGVSGLAETILGWDWLVEWILGMIFPIGFPINLGSMLDLEELLGAPLTDINGILKKFLPDLALPTIDMNTIATLGQLVVRTGSSRTFIHPALQLSSAGQYWAVQADIADVFYYLIEFVLNFASGGGLAALGLDLSSIKVDMIGLDLEKVLTHMSPEDVIAALVELFNPNTTNTSPNGGDTAYVGQYTDGTSPYALNNWNWWYPTEDSVFFKSVEDISVVDFVYLNHENNWTLDKAEFFYNNSIGLVDAILGLLLTDETSKEYQDFYVVGEGSAANYLRNMIEKMFSSDGAWNVVELMGYTLGSLMSGLPEQILGLLENNFGINVNSWFETYGYMFYGEYFAEDGYFQPFDAANGLPEGTTHLTRVNNEIIPHYECLYCSDTDVEDEDGRVVVTGIRDENGDLKPGKKPLSGNFLEHYPQYVNSFSYPADPSTLRQYTCSNCGKRLIITYYATEIEVEEIVVPTQYISYEDVKTTDEDGNEIVIGRNYLTYDGSWTTIDNIGDEEREVKFYIPSNTYYQAHAEKGNLLPASKWVDNFPRVEIVRHVIPDAQAEEAANIERAYNRFEYEVIFDGDTIDTYDRELFVSYTMYMMEDLAPLFNLLLLGEDAKLFEGAFTLVGFNVYDSIIIPLWELFEVCSPELQANAGQTDLKSAAEYLSYVRSQSSASDPTYNATYGYSNAGAVAGITFLTEQLFTWIDWLVTNDEHGKNMVQKIFDLLPNIFYGIQSNFISNLVLNLLHFAIVLVDTIRPIFDLDLNAILVNLLVDLLGNYDDALNKNLTDPDNAADYPNGIPTEPVLSEAPDQETNPSDYNYWLNNDYKKYTEDLKVWDAYKAAHSFGDEKCSTLTDRAECLSSSKSKMN